MLGKEVLPVVEEPGVDVPGYGVDPSAPEGRLHGAREELTPPLSGEDGA